jgi:threonine dehydratase
VIDVKAAAGRIAPYVVRTPVLHSGALDAWVGAEAYVKAEHCNASARSSTAAQPTLCKR